MIDKHKLEYTECDFKREVERTKTKNWLKSVCAFANGIGGVLVFGIDDKTREHVPLKDIQGDIEFITSCIKGGINGGINGGLNGGLNDRINDRINYGLSEQIINLIKSDNFITISQISDILNIPKRTIEREIQKLQENKRITRVGAKKNGYWQIME